MDLTGWKCHIGQGAPPLYSNFMGVLSKFEGGLRISWGLNLMRNLCLFLTNSEDPAELPDDAQRLLEGMKHVTDGWTPQMKRKAVYFVKCMLESEDSLVRIRRAFPLCLRTCVDPLQRQRQLVSQDVIPKSVRGTWVADLMNKIMSHPVSVSWRTSKSANQNLKTVHALLRAMGLLDHNSLDEFEKFLSAQSPDELRQKCDNYNSHLCSTKSRVKQCTRIQNIIFHHVWALFPNPIKTVGFRKRMRTLEELDDELSNSTGRGVEGNDKDVLFLSSEQCTALIRACNDMLCDMLIVKLLLTTGLRRKGVVNIRIQDVAQWNDEKQSWDVDKAGKSLEKGGKTRSFPLYTDVQELIDRWLNGKSDDCRPKTPSRYLFPSSKTNNGQMSPETLGNKFQKICVRAGIPKPLTHLHVMRHTCAHRLLDAGNNARQIAAYLGHASSKTTEQYYLRDSVENITQTIKKPEQWVNGHVPQKSDSPIINQESKDKMSEQPKKMKRPKPSLDVLKQAIRLQSERNAKLNA
jgi:integrase